MGWDCFGDANALVRRDAFFALGGFNAVMLPGGEDSTGEDWELFARAALAGYRLQPVPFPLFWYRRSAASMVHTTSLALYRERTVLPYGSVMPAGLSPMLRLAQGVYHQVEEAKARDAEHRSHKEALMTLMCDQLGEQNISQVSAPSLVVNANFTKGKSGMAEGWMPFGEGYSWFVPSDGFLMMESLEGSGRVLGATQKLLLAQPKATPLLVGARSS
ncbi:hypothetical protein CYMTET_27931, partial [Cymbomonas tetramitiformis]